jgi:hypothetical protein
VQARLLGCSAYEETSDESPYESKYPKDIQYSPDMKQVDLSPYPETSARYFNDAMALLEISPAQINISYFQYPSWDSDFTPPLLPKPTLRASEVVKPIIRGPAGS